MKKRHIYQLSDEELVGLNSIINSEINKGFKLASVDSMPAYEKINTFIFKQISED